MTLYPHQTKAVDEYFGSSSKKILLVSPTGSGKTVIASEIIRRTPGRILFLTHRQEILFQAKERFGDCNVIKAGHDYTCGSRITVAQVQTLARRDLPEADLVVSDESHHIRGSQWQTLLVQYNNAKHLGLTATPFRMDGKGLGKVYDSVIKVASVKELIEQGFLVRPEYWGTANVPKTGRIKKSGGDYNISELSEVCRDRHIISGVVESINKYKHRSVVVYAVDCAHADAICHEVPEALYLDGKTKTEDRNSMLAMFQEGIRNVIVNVQVLTEGWDAPRADTVVLARPTCSTGLYMQMVGRVLRPFHGKDKALVLDHGGNVSKHGFVEEDREVTLEDGLVTRKGKVEKVLHTCDKCLAIFEGFECPCCGHKRKKTYTEIKEHKRELELLKRPLMTQDDKMKKYHEYLDWAEHTGRSPGAAYGRYKHEFGECPCVTWSIGRVMFYGGKPCWKKQYSRAF